MPDFDVRVSGVQVVPWEDPATPTAPSRLNPRFNRKMLRMVGTVGSPVTLSAIAEHTVAPLDAALGGRLFVAEGVESPNPYPVSFSHPVGQSSLQSFTPDSPGHYLVYMRRPQGGMVYAHIDAKGAP